MKVTFTCEQCGKEKAVYPSRLQYAKYCSRSCRSKSNVHKMLPFRHSFSKGWQPPTRFGADASNYRHGLCSKRIYAAWSNMISRCTNPKRREYHRYGGRGIRVCEGLYSSAIGLYMLLGDPPPKLSLNRIDNDANYSCGRCLECLANKWPMNVEWATQRTQARNTCQNRILCLNGECHTVIEWSEILGIRMGTIRIRLCRGMTDEQALSKTRVDRSKTE